MVRRSRTNSISMGLLEALFGKKEKVDLKSLVFDEKAIILDVRSPQEYKGGHIKSAKNVPLQQLKGHNALPKDPNKPIVTCCASGNRSGMAKSQLKRMGYTSVHNGGGWQSLKRKLQ